jgi:ATP-binding cassette, subfamily B, multidrug efflux pump
MSQSLPFYGQAVFASIRELLLKGELIAFISYITQILLALIVVANLVTIFTKAFASATRINELLDTEASLTFPDENVNLSGTEYTTFPHLFAVSFEHVHLLTKHAGQKTLQDITLQIRPFQTVGIIGSTGSGKSTLVNLIPRFYDITSGNLQLFGSDITNYSAIELQKKVSIVPQDIRLFSGTISDNIRFGKEKATEEEIVRAAKLAQAHDFIIQLTDGYQSLVSQNGTNLSGGQKQRIAIARALITKPELLILDDSFSALDYSTDNALRMALHTLSDSTTTLMVSQRISTIKQADQIIVMDHGRIVGYGTHDELVKNCMIYQEICSSQISLQEVDQNMNKKYMLRILSYTKKFKIYTVFAILTALISVIPVSSQSLFDWNFH